MSFFQTTEEHVDNLLNLDNLLILIHSHIAPLWYEFGQAVGIPSDVLNKCLGYSADECTVEVLDYWVRQSKPKWIDVAHGLSEVGLQSLENEILKVYKTGIFSDHVHHVELSTNILSTANDCIDCAWYIHAGKLPIDVFTDASVALDFDNSFQLPPPPIPPKNNS